MGTLRQEVKRLAQVERDKDAEIARLQAEVERLRGVVRNNADYRAHTAWSDEIEAASQKAEECPDSHWGSWCANTIRALRKDHA